MSSAVPDDAMACPNIGLSENPDEAAEPATESGNLLSRTVCPSINALLALQKGLSSDTGKEIWCPAETSVTSC